MRRKNYVYIGEYRGVEIEVIHEYGHFEWRAPEFNFSSFGYNTEDEALKDAIRRVNAYHRYDRTSF